jgi:L-threonylcarbamoyladenylate synthase|tara:strand:+ start:215 stop:796 length:582 start_codon:yes stop_codon:yes gene_type:complete
LQEDNIQKAIACIKNEEVVGIPTETVYGIGVDPLSQAAVDKIFNLKERDENKPLSILVHSFHDLIKLKIISKVPEIVELYWPGPLTIIVESELNFADGVGTKNPNSIGVRVPDNELALELLKKTGPLAVTSANISGQEDITNEKDAESVFGDKIGHYLQGSALHGSGSTIVDFRDEEFKVIREGPLKWPPSYC